MVNLRDRIEAVLASAIISGEMPPGEVYSAPALSKLFNVSATPVREAMLNLEKRGLVEAVRNKGFRVTEMSPQDLRDIVEVRLLLEPPAMAKLAGRFPEDRVDDFYGIAEEIIDGASSASLSRFLAADSAFHIGLLELVGNSLLTEVVSQLRARTRLMGLTGILHTDTLDTWATEHVEILNLLVEGESARVESLMRHHIQNILDIAQDSSAPD